jgi:hypothetical protein
LDGEWVSAEEYLHRRFSVQISHVISDEALARLRQDMKRDGQDDKQ